MAALKIGSPYDESWYNTPTHHSRTPARTNRKSVTFTQGGHAPNHQGHAHSHHHQTAPQLVGRLPSPDDQRHVAADTMDDHARAHFPATFSVPYVLKGIEVKGEDDKVKCPKATGLQKPNVTPWKTNVEKMNLMVSENPATFAAQVMTSSPYQNELGKLRMQRLRLEEDHLLEVKRQEELERIRGPTKKWYELRTPQFHYEVHKNNQLLDSESDWQELLDYRHRLVSSSREARSNVY